MTTPWRERSATGEVTARSSEGAGAGRLPTTIPPLPAGPVTGVASGGTVDMAADFQAETGLPVLHLLVVDDDDAVRNACSDIARRSGFVVVTAGTLDQAREILKHHRVDLILLDLKLSTDSGLSLLEEVKLLHPDTAVIVMTAFATIASAVEAMRIGAGDYLTKPFALDELVGVLERAAERKHFDLESRRLRERLRNPRTAGHLIGSSPAMEKLYRILSKVIHTQHPVLILGESGTGKELVARSIHFNGLQAQRPFVPVDCGSLVPELIEGELFGYARGSHAGGGRAGGGNAKEGLLTAAAGGTVFLDEIGELPIELQAKLLRALQDRAVAPVGATQAIPLTARILAATSRNLAAMVETGRFRKDLYFRLNVVNLRIPPLRERKQDIPLLVQHFLERANREGGVSHVLSDDALRAVLGYDWPGNVRELETAIQRACALSSGPILHMRDLPTQLHDYGIHGRIRRLEPADGDLPGGEQGLAEHRIVSIADLEKQAILGTIRDLKGDKVMAAKLLGIGKTTLYRKLKEYGFGDGLEEEA